MNQPSVAASYVALTTAAVVWGGSIVGQKFTLGAFSAVEISVFRATGALLALIPFWWWTEGPSVKFAPRDWAIFALLSLGVLGNHLFTLFGLKYIGAGAAGIIIGTSPVVTALLSSLLIRDVPFRSVIGGCLVSFAGVILVAGLDGQGMSGASPWLGGLLVVLGLISWAMYSIGGRRTMERFSPLTVNWTTLLLSLIPQVPLLLFDQKGLVAGLETVPGASWLALAYLILFATALGQQAWLYGVKGIGPARAGIFINLIPVSALMLSALVLGEAIGAREITGFALILTGVWLVNWQSQRAL